MGPYGKDIHASTFGLPETTMYAEMYNSIKPLGPDACFELCDPLIWVCLTRDDPDTCYELTPDAVQRVRLCHRQSRFTRHRGQRRQAGSVRSTKISREIQAGAEGQGRSIAYPPNVSDTAELIVSKTSTTWSSRPLPRTGRPAGWPSPASATTAWWATRPLCRGHRT